MYLDDMLMYDKCAKEHDHHCASMPFAAQQIPAVCMVTTMLTYDFANAL